MKIDILKIKKEAVGQVLAETVIRRNEGFTQNPELLRRSFRWWEKIIAYIKNLISMMPDLGSALVMPTDLSFVKGESKNFIESVKNNIVLIEAN